MLSTVTMSLQRFGSHHHPRAPTQITVLYLITLVVAFDIAASAYRMWDCSHFGKSLFSVTPGKAVPELTYSVSGRTLNPTHSLTHSDYFRDRKSDAVLQIYGIQSAHPNDSVMDFLFGNR